MKNGFVYFSSFFPRFGGWVNMFCTIRWISTSVVLAIAQRTYQIYWFLWTIHRHMCALSFTSVNSWKRYRCYWPIPVSILFFSWFAHFKIVSTYFVVVHWMRTVRSFADLLSYFRSLSVRSIFLLISNEQTEVPILNIFLYNDDDEKTENEAQWKPFFFSTLTFLFCFKWNGDRMNETILCF